MVKLHCPNEGRETTFGPSYLVKKLGVSTEEKKVVDESNRWLHVTGQSKIPVFYARLVVPLIILIHLKQFAD